MVILNEFKIKLSKTYLVVWIAAVILSTYCDRVDIIFNTLSKTAIVPGITGRVVTAVLTWYGRHFQSFKFIYQKCIFTRELLICHLKRFWSFIYYTNTQANVSMISQNVITQMYTPKHSLNTVVQIQKSLFHKSTN
jgi:hypothetical protein